ncbi:hypothetical protein [Mucilaginibacter pallidiroseus]|nr:hypothetical protein [Mucilaginibacter pallidiroseus]
MRIEPVKQETDKFAQLTPLERQTRKAAIALAFLGVFVWTFKILFF